MPIRNRLEYQRRWRKKIGLRKVAEYNDPKRSRRWYLKVKKSPEYKAKMKVINDRYAKRHPERRRAKNKVYWEVKCGRLKKRPCQVCGKRKVQAHHEDYDKPIEVVWLCHKHHVDHHRKYK